MLRINDSRNGTMRFCTLGNNEDVIIVNKKDFVFVQSFQINTAVYGQFAGRQVMHPVQQEPRNFPLCI